MGKIQNIHENKHSYEKWEAKKLSPSNSRNNIQHVVGGASWRYGFYLSYSREKRIYEQAFVKLTLKRVKVLLKYQLSKNLRSQCLPFITHSPASTKKKKVNDFQRSHCLPTSKWHNPREHKEAVELTDLSVWLVLQKGPKISLAY